MGQRFDNFMYRTTMTLIGIAIAGNVVSIGSRHGWFDSPQKTELSEKKPKAPVEPERANATTKAFNECDQKPQAVKPDPDLDKPAEECPLEPVGP